MRGFLIDCSRIETLASKGYQHLANNKTYAKEVCKVFQKLSYEERAHARHIDLVLPAEQKEVAATQMIAWEKISHGVTLAEAMLQKVERERLSEEDALRLTVDMEQQFLKVHVNNVLHCHNQKLADLFNKLGSEDEEHLNTLKDCLRWWHAERKRQLAGS